MVILLLVIYLTFYSNGHFNLAIDSVDSIDYLGWIFVFSVIYTYFKRVNYNIYYEDFSEWLFFFIIVAKLRYYHILYLKTIYRKMHYYYSLFKVFISYMVNDVIHIILNNLPIYMYAYLVSGFNYLNYRLNLLLTDYSKEYKYIILNKMFISVL